LKALTVPGSRPTIDSADFRKHLFAFITAEAGSASDVTYKALVAFVDAKGFPAPSITMNARQLQQACALANPDGVEDPCQQETVVTLTQHEAFRATNLEDGQDENCLAGLYLHFDDMPDEGVMLLNPEEPAPTAPPQN
jgi:hypothetical protein